MAPPPAIRRSKRLPKPSQKRKESGRITALRRSTRLPKPSQKRRASGPVTATQKQSRKRKASGPATATQTKAKVVTEPAEETSDPVAQWVATASWPTDLSTVSSERPSSHSSTTEERDGPNLISQASKKLIKEMLKAHYDDEPQFERSVSGFLEGLLVQSWPPDWPGATSTLGLNTKNFTIAEVEKIKSFLPDQYLQHFVGGLFFPHLISQVVADDTLKSEAEELLTERCSTALDAIINLHSRVLGDDESSRLSGEVLLFSITRDRETIKISGHYPIIEGAETTFHRYIAREARLGPRGIWGNFIVGKECYEFVRKVDEDFLPAHVKRIKDLLAKMQDPQEGSVLSAPTSEQDQPEGSVTSAPTSEQGQPEGSMHTESSSTDTVNTATAITDSNGPLGQRQEGASTARMRSGPRKMWRRGAREEVGSGIQETREMENRTQEHEELGRKRHRMLEGLRDQITSLEQISKKFEDERKKLDQEIERLGG
ncbi:hypothetical protein Z517_09404 [Fonsecaea pedrosoi CBS 271.37]|uniref:DUF7924 domain-containing protein n=1 Tax=Fonsecaea pedrosoi CBS 271.37 TaxID=1442368 RepID=A0A0D2GEB2_9EURO|nr:uncharacterized protein Z517_09404 [Fonsecaea pedrosoi CBS 271.37]KIW76960.1 hypothetical protein Z517_09404 [Fonsecaea pedrosoi CBS 271.37]